ncbi:MAG: tRNA (guanine(10)-N(2))-dimethyltransferase [Candidatus Methanomethylicaceae archaeon]
MRLIRIREGKTILLVPDFSQYARQGTYDPSKTPVFYNPKMEFSRDLGVIVLEAYSKTVHRNMIICDPLAGVGARGIRYAKEVGSVAKSVVSDLNKDAIPIIIENVKINGLEKLVEIHCKDANSLLAKHSEPGERFDFIDLDPFGTPVPFLDSAIRAIKSKGLIAITATDTAPLCGVYPKACFRKYGAFPLRGEFCHEVGLRILIGAVVLGSIRQDFGATVLLSYSVDHYFRAYIQVNLGAKKADTAASLMGFILYCPSCGWREVIPLNGDFLKLCPFCQKKCSRAGPLWCGTLADKAFLMSVMNQDLSALILIGAVVLGSIRQDFGATVLLSYSVDHYFRAYIQVNLGAKKADTAASLMGFILYCPSCGWREVIPLNGDFLKLCPFCQKKCSRAGPLWCGTLADKAFLMSVMNQDLSALNSKKRIEKLLTVLIQESEMPPTYYSVDFLSSILKRSPSSISSILEGLREKGYSASPTHFNSKAFKTKAPLDVIMKVIESSPHR